VIGSLPDPFDEDDDRLYEMHVNPPPSSPSGPFPSPLLPEWPAVVAETRRLDRRTGAIITDARVISAAGCWLAFEVKSPVLVELAKRGLPTIEKAVRRVLGDGWTVEPCLAPGWTTQRK
jgi:hypothetical protein